MNELLINFYCPSTSKSYDFWVPKTMTVQAVISQICDAICELENNPDIFPDRSALLLCSYLGKKTLATGLSLGQAGIKSGDRLALV